MKVPRGPDRVKRDGEYRDLRVPMKLDRGPATGVRIVGFGGDTAVVIGRMLRAEWRAGYRAALKARRVSK